MYQTGAPAAGRSQAGRKEVLKVTDRQQSTNAFDFSQDALDFRARLWQRIQTRMAVTSVQELEDDELEWVNAAGTPIAPRDQDDRV